jgi:hypothetical protein
MVKGSMVNDKQGSHDKSDLNPHVEKEKETEKEKQDSVNLGKEKTLFS